MNPEPETGKPSIPKEKESTKRSRDVLQVWKVQESLNEEYIEIVIVNDQETKAYRDTGAQVSFIQPELVQKQQYLQGGSYTLKEIRRLYSFQDGDCTNHPR